MTFYDFSMETEKCVTQNQHLKTLESKSMVKKVGFSVLAMIFVMGIVRALLPTVLLFLDPFLFLFCRFSSVCLSLVTKGAYSSRKEITEQLLTQ